MSFASLGLSEPIVRAVAECGYSAPTPIQSQAIPVVLSGRDLLAGAQTGTGKTAGFTLPILQRLMDAPSTGSRPAIRVLILTPTRELAAQVEENVRDYGRHLPLESMVMFGGVGFQPQADRLKKRVDILVATPGRLLDHAQQKTVDLSHVEILVLDEADRMLDMGFIRDIRRVLALLPKKRQNLLFSATFPDEIRDLADSLLDDPATVEVARRNAATELVTQSAIFTDKTVKRALLTYLIRTRNWHQVLVFTRTKHGANRLAEQLAKDGIPALAIHGNKSQGARTRALSEFKDGSLQVLVATEIAARGLDIVELPYVVNFELPNVPEDYVHRIGRTGRAGAEGIAVSLVSDDEKPLLVEIEKVLKRSVPRETVEGFDLQAALAEARARRPAEAASERPSSGRRDGQRSGRTERSRGEARPGARPGQPAARGAGPRPSAASPSQPRGAGDGAGRRRSAQSEPGNRARPQGEIDGNRARLQREVDGNRVQPQREVDGNRAEPLREVDGNRAPPVREVDGNRAGRASRPAERREGGGRGSERRAAGAGGSDRRPGGGSRSERRPASGGRSSATDRSTRSDSGPARASAETQRPAREPSMDDERKRNGRLKGALTSALTALRRFGQ